MDAPKNTVLKIQVDLACPHRGCRGRIRRVLSVSELTTLRIAGREVCTKATADLDCYDCGGQVRVNLYDGPCVES